MEISKKETNNNTTKKQKKNPQFSKNAFATFVLASAIALGGLLLLSRFTLKLDLTSNDRHTLSPVSKEIVSQLEDPLRISVFLSKNLPPPMNELRTTLEDLLYLYEQSAGEKFTYVFYDIDEKEEGISDEAEKNKSIADDYGIRAHQVQTVEKDEIKLVNAYMSMVIEYGDLIERIPVIDINSSIEYSLSSILDRMNSQINKLIALEDPMQLTLYLPADFVAISPYFGVEGLDTVQDTTRELAESMLRKTYGKIDYKEALAPLSTGIESEGVLSYPWNGFAVEGNRFDAGVGAAALVLENGDQRSVIELLRGEQTLQIVDGGLQAVVEYSLIDQSDIEAKLEASIESVLNVNKRVAAINSMGAVDLGIDSYSYDPSQLNQAAQAANFGALLKKHYQVSSIDFDGLDTRYGAVVLAGIQQPLSDYQLYQLDQFLMNGGSLLVFHDMFVEEPNLRGGGFAGNIPKWKANPSKLETLLAHYGVKINPAIVMDEKSFVGRQQQADGTVTEQVAYFAPLIQNNSINTEFYPMEKLKGFVMIAGSPVVVEEAKLLEKGVIASRLFSSSPNSWLDDEEVSLVPFLIEKPTNEENFTSYPMGYALEAEVEGGFASFFNGKEVPAKNDEVDGTEEAVADAATKNQLDAEISRREKSLVGARIVVIGSSQILRNNVVDPSGAAPNATLLANIVDYGAKQEGWISVRAKSQKVNPLDPFDPEASLLKRVVTNPQVVKTTNMVILPILVVLFGGLFYLRRKSHRLRIQSL